MVFIFGYWFYGGSGGRVVKAIDSKSITVSVRRFESYPLRCTFLASLLP
jgi:hypothetical protein